jgi:hypothetical protein
MTTVITIPVAAEPILFSVTEETIESQAANMLTMSGATSGGLAEVRSAKSRVVKARTTIEAERKAAKEPYKLAGEGIDARAKKLVAMLTPIEEHLVNEIKQAEAREAAEEAKKLDERFAERKERLNAAGGCNASPASVRMMNDLVFSEFLIEVAEQNRQRREREEADRIERERLAAEREASRIEAEKLKAERDAEREALRIEAEKLKAERDAERESLRREREALDAEKQKIEAARPVTVPSSESLRPVQPVAVPVNTPTDREKVEQWAGRVALMKPPTLADAAMFTLLEDCIRTFAQQILEVVK